MTPLPATTLLVTTGNLLHTTVTGILNGALKRSQEEVYDAVRDTLATGHASTSTKGVTVETANSVGSGKQPNEPTVSADDLQVSAKLFLYPTTTTATATADTVDTTVTATEQVATALRQLQRRLQLDHVDNFTVAFANFKLDDDLMAEEDKEGDEASPTAEWPDMALLRQVWQTLASEHLNGRVRAVGVSEFSQQRLEAFRASVSLAPASNQVNMADCCIIPRELIAYCRAHDIDLVTHSDASDLLPDTRLHQLLAEHPLPSIVSGDDDNNGDWTVRWVLKFSVLVSSRGVLHDKGYIVYATRG